MSFNLTPSGTTSEKLFKNGSGPTYWGGVFNELSQQTDYHLKIQYDSYTGDEIQGHLTATTHSKSTALLAGFHGCTTITLQDAQENDLGHWTEATGVGANTSTDIPWDIWVSLDVAHATNAVDTPSEYRTC